MKCQKDPIGNRIKGNYENRTRYYLPRRTYTIIRLDGKSFHTYTKGLNKPYDIAFNYHMDITAKHLLKEVEGCQLVYTQSDEISLLLTDFGQRDTQAWFDGNIQKICSVSASIATAYFNSLRLDKLAYFDSRVFTIPDRNEVANYFVWRTRDCIRNSILALGQHHFSHRELHGKNTSEIQDMLVSRAATNWNDYAMRFKNGSLQIRDGGLIDIPKTKLFDFYIDLIPEYPQ